MAQQERFNPYAAPETRQPPAKKDDKGAPAKRSAPRIGFLDPRGIERAFRTLLYLTLLALVVLSVVGTYYGLAQQTAPLLTPGRIYADIRANTDRLWVAIAIQVFLTLTQYGSRTMARHDRRWWFLYLASLSISVYYNYQAYWTPLNVITLGPIAAAVIVAGDVLPEFIAIRRE
jgi:hypothetical protein